MLLVAPANAGLSVEVVYGVGEATGKGPMNSSLDGENLQNISARIVQDFGSTGILSGLLNLERLALPDLPDDPAAYCLDSLVRLQTTGSRFQLYGTGGIGVVFSDNLTIEQSQEVEIEVGDSVTPSPQHRTTSEDTVIITTESTDQTVNLRWNIQAGGKVYFDSQQRWGIGVEYALAKPMGSGFLIDEDERVQAYLIVPAGN